MYKRQFRGRAARDKSAGIKAERAAVRVQAFARGHASRDAQQEVRRVEWLKFYASDGEYAKAMELAVTQREVDAISAMQSRAAAATERPGWCRCFAPPPPVAPAGGLSNGNGHPLI